MSEIPKPTEIFKPKTVEKLFQEIAETAHPNLKENTKKFFDALATQLNEKGLDILKVQLDTQEELHQLKEQFGELTEYKLTEMTAPLVEGKHLVYKSSDAEAKFFEILKEVQKREEIEDFIKNDIVESPVEAAAIDELEDLKQNEALRNVPIEKLIHLEDKYEGVLMYAFCDIEGADNLNFQKFQDIYRNSSGGIRVKVNFRNNPEAERQLGAADILPPSVRKISVLKGGNENQIRTSKRRVGLKGQNVAGRGFFDTSYIPVFSGDTVILGGLKEHDSPYSKKEVNVDFDSIYRTEDGELDYQKYHQSTEAKSDMSFIRSLPKHAYLSKSERNYPRLDLSEISDGEVRKSVETITQNLKFDKPGRDIPRLQFLDKKFLLILADFSKKCEGAFVTSLLRTVEDNIRVYRNLSKRRGGAPLKPSNSPHSYGRAIDFAIYTHPVKEMINAWREACKTHNVSSAGSETHDLGVQNNNHFHFQINHSDARSEPWIDQELNTKLKEVKYQKKIEHPLDISQIQKNYGTIVKTEAAKYDIDPKLIYYQIHQESGGDPRAGSYAGAKGLMQLMPGTAKELGVSDVYDPEQNIIGGVKYLAQQYERFGNYELALAAYNSGPGNIQKAIKKGKDWNVVKNNLVTNAGAQRETINYVDTIMGNYHSRKHTEEKTETDNEIKIPSQKPKLPFKEILLGNMKPVQDRSDDIEKAKADYRDNPDHYKEGNAEGPMANPKRLIVLDLGHDDNSGADNEASVIRKIAPQVLAQLTRLGYDVLIPPRGADNLSQRIGAIQGTLENHNHEYTGGVMSISLHADVLASKDGKYKSEKSRALALTDNTKASNDLAQFITDAYEETGIHISPKAEVKQMNSSKHLAGSTEMKIPSVLLEMGNLLSPKDLEKLENDSEYLASRIVQGIVNYSVYNQ